MSTTTVHRIDRDTQAAMRRARTVVFHQYADPGTVEVVCHSADRSTTTEFLINDGGRWFHGLAEPFKRLRVVAMLEEFDEGLKRSVLSQVRIGDELYVYNRLGASNTHHLDEAGLVLLESFLLIKRGGRRPAGDPATEAAYPGLQDKPRQELRFLFQAGVLPVAWCQEFGYVAA